MFHYYGDLVRKFFTAGAIIMAGSLPFFAQYISEPVPASIAGILVILVAAGLTSPKFTSSMIIDIIVSLGAAAVFEWYAVNLYASYGTTPFFFVNQILALIFLVALYFSIKTIRGARMSKMLAEKQLL